MCAAYYNIPIKDMKNNFKIAQLDHEFNLCRIAYDRL